MPQKQPVFIGTITRDPESGADSVSTDVIVNVSDDLYQVLGSPTLDPAALQGKVRTGPNGDYRYPKNGTRNGVTITLFTDAQTTGAKTKTHQMQLPRNCPLHVLDKYLSGVTFPTTTIVAFKKTGGKRIPVGQTVVA